jgi:3-oxoadipate enol-lactonase
MNYKVIDGATIHYLDQGQGPAVVFVHGFPLDGRIWEDQLREFSRDHRVIVPDLRGFGQSPSSDAFTIESQAEDVHKLLEELGGLPYVLAGLSMGGYVALACARKCPTDLRGLILVDTRAEGDSPEAREGRGRMIDLVRASGSAAVANEMMPKLIADSSAKSRPQLVKRLRQIMENCPPLTIEHALAAMRDRPDMTEYLPSISMPTLVVVGESDAITPPAVAKSMADAIPQARLQVIRGAGHMTPMEQPQEVNRAIRGFLESLPT